MTSTLIAHCGTTKISRDELRTIPAPLATATFKPIPHHELVDALIETLGFRKIGVVKDEYAASADGMKLSECWISKMDSKAAASRSVYGMPMTRACAWL